MGKIKYNEKEIEVPDELTELAVDETGVPWRNRAAEHRRKLEKAQKRLEALEEAEQRRTQAAEEAARARPAPAAVQPLWQVPTYGYPQYQSGYTSASAAQPLTTDQVRALAKEEQAAARRQDEYERELAKLKEEWPAYDDEKEQLTDYLRSKGYEDEQIEEFGPRDIRLARDGMRSARASRNNGRRNPQEVILDTGSASDEALSAAPLYTDPDKIRTASRAEINRIAQEAKARPRLSDE